MSHHLSPNSASSQHTSGRLIIISAFFAALFIPNISFAQTPSGRVVQTGTITGIGSNLCVNGSRVAMGDGFNVELGQCRNGSAAWDVIDLGGGEFAILNRASRRVMDVAGGSFDDGANVQQYVWNNTAAQRWRIESIANITNGAVQIVNQRSGKCLDINERSTVAGANIHQWQCHGKENQQWRFTRTSGAASQGSAGVFNRPGPAALPNQSPSNLPGVISGTAVIGERPVASNNSNRPSYGGKPYSDSDRTVRDVNGILQGRQLYSGMIVSRASAKCIDVEGAKREDGINVRQWTCNGTNAQLWDFMDLGRGEMLIVARASNKVLDVVGANPQDGANIAQYAWNGGNHQRWRLEPAGRGYFKLVSVGSNKCVDVDNAGHQDGANIHQWSCHGKENQQWRIEVSGAGSSWTNYQPQANSPSYPSNSSNPQPNSRYSDAPPAYLVGTWDGFNPVYQGNVRLSIYSDGTAQAIIDDHIRLDGYFRGNRLYLGAERYDIQQERRGFRTLQIGQPNNVVSYSRAR